MIVRIFFLLKRPHLLQQRIGLNRKCSVTSTPRKSRNPITRALVYLRNDPFARVSILFGGTVLVVLLIIESFIPKPQKRVKPQVAVLPPKTTHPVISRVEQLDIMTNWIPSFYSLKPYIAMVTGPSACGKTELAYQFAQKFISHCSPWLMSKPSKQPIVLYIDASSKDALLQSSSFCAHAFGIKSSEIHSSVSIGGNTAAATISCILTNLSKQKAKWLLIVDGIADDTCAVIDDCMKQLSGYKYRKGTLLLTSKISDHPLTSANPQLLSLPSSLGKSDALKLFSRVAEVPLSELPEDICLFDAIGSSSPLSLSLAALTVRVYNHFYKSLPTAISRYIDMVNNDNPTYHKDHCPFHKPLELFVDALSACDSNYMNAIDFIGSCSHDFPIPVSFVRQHLKHSFYRLNVSSEVQSLMSVSTNDVMDAATEPRPSISNYLSVVKSKLPVIGGGSDPQAGILQQMQQGEVPTDHLRLLMMSPFIRVSDLTGYDIQLLHIHPSASDIITNNFINTSLSRLEEQELSRGKVHWDRTAWFKRFRSFDSNHCLASFRSSLPGLKEGKAYTESQYRQQFEDANSSRYTQYLHLASHIHRVVSGMCNEMRFLGKDTEDLLMKKHLLPHIEHILKNKQKWLTDKDTLRLETSLLGIRSILSNATYNDLVLQYNSLLSAHFKVYGETNVATASALTSLAELHYHNEAHQEAIQLLQRAVSIHESVPPHTKTSEQTTDQASSLSLLGLTYAAIGEKQLCIKYLEQALNLYQSIPSDGDITKSQRKVVASMVTDLGHAYIIAGDVNSAKKYLDLASIAQRGVHGDYHPEVVRTLNVLSIVYTLMGDTPESRSVGREAGEIQKELSVISDII